MNDQFYPQGGGFPQGGQQPQGYGTQAQPPVNPYGAQSGTSYPQ